MTVSPILDYRAGDTLALDFNVVDDDTGDAVDLTGATAQWNICTGTINAIGSVIYSRHIGSGIVITDAPNGKLAVTVAKGAFTRVGDFVHVLKVTLATGVGYTVAYGALKSNSSPAWS